MDWTAISLGLLTTGVLVLYITRPWWARRGNTQPELNPTRNIRTLVERREAVLTALRDLEFDHAVGKMNEEDYGPLHQTLMAEAAAIMSQLGEAQAAEAALEARLKVEILTVRQPWRDDQPDFASLPGQSCLACGQVARPGNLYCASCGTRLAPACPECGKSVRSTDRFCAGCGLELALALAR